MARSATIQLKVHRQIVQSIPLDDIECLIQGLRLVTPCTQRLDRLIDLLEQRRSCSYQIEQEPMTGAAGKDPSTYDCFCHALAVDPLLFARP